MKYVFILLTTVLFSLSAKGQNLPVAWEELTASDFVEAVKKSEGVCLIPVGVIEKHGQHLPVGTDYFIVQEICRRLAEKEYCIVYPTLFTGVTFEAYHQPGAISYSPELLFQFLDETCREIARNGIKKIVLVNGNGSNNSFLNYFCQAQLDTPRDYAVYWIYQWEGSVSNYKVDEEARRKISEMRKTTGGGHGAEMETSMMMAIRPDLVKLERANLESGQNLNRLQHLPSSTYLGIKWYAQYPNLYEGDASSANADLGKIYFEGLDAELIKIIKADDLTLPLHNEYYEETLSPLDTKAK